MHPSLLRTSAASQNPKAPRPMPYLVPEPSPNPRMQKCLCASLHLDFQHSAANTLPELPHMGVSQKWGYSQGYMQLQRFKGRFGGSTLNLKDYGLQGNFLLGNSSIMPPPASACKLASLNAWRATFPRDAPQAALPPGATVWVASWLRHRG